MESFGFRPDVWKNDVCGREISGEPPENASGSFLGSLTMISSFVSPADGSTL